MTACVRTAILAAAAGIAFGIAPSEAQTLPTALALSCAACHGTDGKSPGAIPTIDGRSVKEMKEALTGFKAGTRQATVMNRLAKGYTDQEIDQLAEYFSKIK